ncbi:hypothetical protein ElyMa_004137200 [Elysia marginata]|uniref:Uncharacterized protein n=1 Tax=Elysia marginata TaxID=1093978 RepID=A0AAV4GFK2_9GAST|nr:hypothetical protein ElyMa_004137200 [Elysia marginata]
MNVNTEDVIKPSKPERNRTRGLRVLARGCRLNNVRGRGLAVALGSLTERSGDRVRARHAGYKFLGKATYTHLFRGFGCEMSTRLTCSEMPCLYTGLMRFYCCSSVSW